MKYLCMGFHDEQAWNAISPSVRDALLAETFAYSDTLRRAGHVLGEQALHSARTAATLRFEQGQMLVTDGPFAETKEQLGGFMLLEADDLNHAIGLMSKIPCMRMGGSLEIRPINEQLNAANAEGALATSTR